MNNFQLENILRKDVFSSRHFLGIFSRNNLPRKFVYPCSFIFNSDKNTGKGEHWLSIYFTKDEKCLFLDSLGLGPQFYGMEKYIKKRATFLSFNKHPIQSMESNFCGLYCLLFILIISRGISFKKFLQHFSLKTIKNDILIRNLLEKYK